MDIFEQIKTIPIENILDSVGLHYKKKGNTINIYEEGKITDGWKANINDGYVTDFSGKRAEGDRITFIMKYYGVDKKTSVNWYKERFNLKDTEYKKKDPQKGSPKQSNYKTITDKIKEKWKNLPNLTEPQIEYVNSRGINFESIKNIVRNDNGMIAIPIYNERGQMITIQKRSIEGKLFIIDKGTQSKGVYMNGINKENKKIYVVEGMFDFLTLRQYETNVVGLKSVNDGIEAVKEFYKKGYEIILIPDDDEAGHTVQDKLNDIKYSLFDVGNYGVKDINELVLETGFKKEVIDLIEEERIKEKTSSEMALDKLQDIQKLYRDRGKRGVDGPFKGLDKYTQGVIEGKVYTIGAYSNTGKSQLSYEYASYFLKQGKKVLFISTEVGTGDLLAFIARNYYKGDYYKILSGEQEINIKDFKDLYLYDNVKDFNKIKELAEQLKPDYIFIDFIQSITHIGNSEYEKMTNLAISIQELAISKNITIFNLSQVNNDSRNKSEPILKGSGALYFASDVVFVLYKKENKTYLSITKNKFGKTNIEFEFDINFNTGEIRLDLELTNMTLEF